MPNGNWGQGEEEEKEKKKDIKIKAASGPEDLRMASIRRVGSLELHFTLVSAPKQ